MVRSFPLPANWRTFARITIVALLTIALTPPSQAEDRKSPAPAPNRSAATWIRTELYVGMSEGGHPDVTPQKWNDYLELELAPRFPGGVFVLDGYGQWKGIKTGAIETSRSRIILLFSPDTPADRAAIEAVRIAWTKATGYDSILSSIQPVRVGR